MISIHLAQRTKPAGRISSWKVDNTKDRVRLKVWHPASYLCVVGRGHFHASALEPDPATMR
jgi:hypothetical protein